MQQTKLSQEEGDEMLIRVFLFCEIYLKACSNIKVEGKTNKSKKLIGTQFEQEQVAQE